MGCTYLLVRSRRCCDCDQGRAAIQWDDRKMIVRCQIHYLPAQRFHFPYIQDTHGCDDTAPLSCPTWSINRQCLPNRPPAVPRHRGPDIGPSEPPHHQRRGCHAAMPPRSAPRWAVSPAAPCGQSPQQLRVGVLAGTQKIIGHDSTLESSVLSGYHVPMSLIDTRVNLRLLSLQERDLAVDLGGLVIIKGRRDCWLLAEKLHESFCRRFLASRVEASLFSSCWESPWAR